MLSVHSREQEEKDQTYLLAAKLIVPKLLYLLKDRAHTFDQLLRMIKVPEPILRISIHHLILDDMLTGVDPYETDEKDLLVYKVSAGCLFKWETNYLLKYLGDLWAPEFVDQDIRAAVRSVSN